MKPVRKTKSEEVFEAFLTEVGIPWEPIPVADGEKTPDYDLYAGGKVIVAELKQSDPNPEEIGWIKELAEKRITGYTKEPGARVRKLIKRAMPQLRKRAKGISPGVVVVYNNVDLPFRMFEDSEVMAAMLGLRTVRLAIPPSETGAPIRTIGEFFGGKRAATPTDNTTLSAVAALEDLSSEPSLRVFHNPHAAIPLDSRLLRHKRIRHFKLSTGPEGANPAWTEIAEG